MVADQEIFNYGLIVLFLISPLATISIFLKGSPYGRHHDPKTGTTIPTPLAWFLFESPPLWLTLLLFPLGQNHSNPKAMISISLYLIHYIHRTLIYPVMLYGKNPSRKKSKGFPIKVAMLGFSFNLLNAYLQVRSITHYAVYDSDKWFWWRFVGGLVVYVMGMVVNVTSDYALLQLKSEAGGGYKIPRGGMFEFVSCPNFFGEIIEWLGWSLVTWSWVQFGFFFHSCANLVPRAIANHKWYFKKFGEDYPKNRKAVIPFLC